MYCSLEFSRRLSGAPTASEPKQSSENQPAEIPITLNEVKSYTPSDPTPKRPKLHS